ncbi:MAG: hypothetical protein KDG50_03175 [Chromatiales bacterium]|nr:hypothetical protein [Chromatiales bacterium]
MLDTIKIRFRNDCLPGKDYRRPPAGRVGWTTIENDYPERTVLTYQSNARGNFGAFIRWTPEDDEGLLEFSARTLLDRYLEGIHSGTIEQAFDRIATEQGAQFDLDRLAQVGIVLRADAAAGVDVEDKPQTLLGCRARLLWPYKRKDDRFSESLLFYNTREEISIYDKLAELKAGRKRRIDDGRFCLYQYHRAAIENMVRFEYRAKRKEPIRKAFHAGVVVDQVLKNPASGRRELYHRTKDVTYLGDVLDRSVQRRALRESWGRLKKRPAGEHDGTQLLAVARAENWSFGRLRALAGALHLWELAGRSRDVLADGLGYLPRPTISRALKEIEGAIALLDPALKKTQGAFELFESRLLEELAA